MLGQSESGATDFAHSHMRRVQEGAHWAMNLTDILGVDVGHSAARVCILRHLPVLLRLVLIQLFLVHSLLFGG